MTNSRSSEKPPQLHEVYTSSILELTSTIDDRRSGNCEQQMQGLGYTHPAVAASMRVLVPRVKSRQRWVIPVFSVSMTPTAC